MASNLNKSSLLGTDDEQARLHALIGSVAHAFNNLLASAMGHVELALSIIPDRSPASSDLAYSLNKLQQMANLCHRTLSHSGTGVFNMVPTDLRAVIEVAEQQLRPSLPQHVSLEIQQPDVPVYIRGDFSPLVSMVNSITKNAIEAIDRQGGMITIATGTKNIGQSFLEECHCSGEIPSGDYAYIEITDNGYGMDRILLSKLFTPLFSTKGPGRGIGLVEAQGIALIHKGAIAVKSAPGNGSIFTVLFPTDTENTNESPASPRDPEIAETPGGLILIADDEAGVRRYANRILTRRGFDTMTASDGQEAVDIFREHADHIDLVLLDVFMPKLDGDQVLKMLRSIMPNVKFLLISGYQEAALSGRFSKEDLNRFLFKPFSTADFIQRVNHVLNEQS